MGQFHLDRQKLTVAGIVLAVILFVALNVYGSLALRGLRLDLTQNRQFTLASGTEELLAKLDEPITLRFYASRALRDANPFLGSYADRVHDLLRSYAEASNGNITVEYLDPEPFSPEEDRAVGFGLDPLSLEGGSSAGYLGIAGQSVPLLRRVTRFHRLAQSGGVLVTSLELNAPAAAAGVREGDLIVAFDGAAVESLDDLHRLLTDARIGTQAPLTILRHADRLTVDVYVQERE